MPKNPVKILGRRLLYWLHHRHDPERRQWCFEHATLLEGFENKHQDEDCFIIGNGPSLNQMDLSLLNEYHTFGLNKIHLIFERIQLDLSYHVAVNPLVIEQSISDFTHLNCPSFLSYRPTRKLVKKTENLYFILTGESLNFQTNIKQPFCEGYTVTYVAMQLAYIMGFKRVFLIGVDHNFKAQGKPNQEQYLEGEDLNHFAPDYFGNQNWHLPDLEASELYYRIADFQYRRNERMIFDATVGGKLDIFPKISFSQALQECEPRRFRQSTKHNN